MSYIVKHKGVVVYRANGQPKSIKECFFNLPNPIRQFASQCEIELFDKKIDYKTKAKERSLNLRATRNKKYYNKIKNDKIQCDCGSLVVKTGYKRHIQSKKHKDICGSTKQK